MYALVLEVLGGLISHDYRQGRHHIHNSHGGHDRALSVAQYTRVYHIQLRITNVKAERASCYFAMCLQAATLSHARFKFQIDYP